MFGLQDSDDEDVEGEIDDQIEVSFFLQNWNMAFDQAWYIIFTNKMESLI